MCLHRTKADQVAQVADELVTLKQTPDAFLNNAKALGPAIASLGLRWRSENLRSAAEFIRDKMKGRVPDNWQELTSVPSVGDYIASAVLCFAFGRSSVLLDTNTLRIARRIAGENLKRSKWELRLSLHELAGDRGADTEWNQALLDLGALVCRSRAPKCGVCPVRGHCVTGRSTAPDEGYRKTNLMAHENMSNPCDTDENRPGGAPKRLLMGDSTANVE